MSTPAKDRVAKPALRVRLRRLAPSIGIGIANVGPPLRITVERYAELAGALGVNLASAAVTEARARFDAAAEAIRTATGLG